MICLVLLSVAALVLSIIDREIPEEHEMAILEILTALVKGGMTPVGACAMGGNMMAESGMKANIAQRGMTSLTDEQYTAAADAGTIDFVYDGVGYGLIQLTFYSRKAIYLNYAKSLGVSVGNEEAQVQFVLKELQSEYKSLWEYLKAAQGLYSAAARICLEYERPAVNNIQERADFGNALYMQYGATLEEVAKDINVPDNNVGNIDREPKAYIMGTVRYGDHTPEAAFLMAKLKEVGYDVLWEGLNNCVRDFQQKRGLTVDGIVGEKTWWEVLK